MAELKPCPFCGTDDAILVKGKQPDGNVSYEIAFVECNTCGCRTDSYITDGYMGVKNTVRDAINAWNKRAADEELEFMRQYIHDQGLEWDLLSKWNERKKRDE
jgi:Lar family restriction alleviation protein